MDFIKEIKADLIEENGIKIPAFIFQVSSIEKALEFMKYFRITPMPINMPMLSRISPSQDYPNDALLRIELAFEDPLPDNAYEIYLNEDQVSSLSKANIEAKKIKYCMEDKEKKSGKIKRIELYTDDKYILDWNGILGIVFLNRISSKELSEEKIKKLINIIEIHGNENGYATGMFTELGYLYKLLGNNKKAISFYIEEIKMATDSNDNTQFGAAKAINNLGVIYKGNKDIKNAIALFKLAIALNMNYFEAYLNIAGIINNYELSIQCIARAYKIRPDSPSIKIIIENLSNFYKLSNDEVINKINLQIYKIDLSKPISNLEIVDLNLTKAIFI